MSTAAMGDLFDHEGPWTEHDYLALPEDRRRIELLDGGLLMSPNAGSEHQRLSSHLWHALLLAAPEELEVLEAVNVRAAPGKILIPDLAVVTPPGLKVKIFEPDQIVMVVELSGPGSVAVDRAVKPGLYAQAGIPYYLRIELSQHAPCALAYTLRGGRYELAHQFLPGEPLRLAEPFAIDIDLATLAQRTRPPA
ncbi:MAG: Uma2 family endonuclease [Egibacteraceae bacterium]